MSTIHGLEQSGGTSYLVIEFMLRETLQERVKQDNAPRRFSSTDWSPSTN
jgi:hypothetical protein